MQSLNSTQENCKDQISIEKNEIFRSSKVLYHRTSEPVGNCDNFEFPNRLNSRQEYGPAGQDQQFIVETSKQIIKISGIKLDEGYKNNLQQERMCTSQSFNFNTELKLLSSSSITRNESYQNFSSDVEERLQTGTFGKTFASLDGPSVSENHSNTKNDYLSGALKRAAQGQSGGWDSNDNINNKKVPSSEMFDINDNPSGEFNIQRDAGETSLSENDESGQSDCEAPCGIGLLERLIRSHPVWFLPGIQRAGAVHLLQGKEEGNFIVRQSSQPDTMAVSVRLPAGKGPYIEHYLIQANEGQLSLESSENMFESIPSLIAHYCQCCDELPVTLTLPRTIREAKNRQQLSSLALLGQEFWRYPMANPRPPESQNTSPNNNKSDRVSLSESDKKTFGNNKKEEIVLDLVPLSDDTHSQGNSLSTFKSYGAAEGSEEKKPKRPHTLDLMTTNPDKNNFGNGNKTPPQPPPRWTKPQPQSVFTKPSFNIANDFIKLNPIITSNENEFTKIENKDLFSLGLADYDRNISSPQSDQTNLKSFGRQKNKNSLMYFHDGNKFELISPVSDNTNLISKSLEKASINDELESVRSEKLERVMKRYKHEGKVKQSAHYQESDILESPTSYYYKSNVADKQSDYEDIWATDCLITFKPQNVTPTEGGESSRLEDKLEPKKTPDLLEKLENPLRRSLRQKREDRNSGSGPNESASFESQVRDVEDCKQSSPFYAEPADALVLRRRARLTSSTKSRHSDPFSFNNWSNHANPYFSGGNILGRIDSQNDMNEDLNWKSKPSLSFDNIINLKKNDTDPKSKANQRAKMVVKGKPVRPPKVYNTPLEKSQGTWTVDSSWEFIGNEENEKEVERKFPSIEQQMDSDDVHQKHTVQEMIAKRFPHFKISRATWCRRSGSGEDSLSWQSVKHQKFDGTRGSSRISAYDNLSSDRVNYYKSGNESEKNMEINCDSYTNYSPGCDQSVRMSESEGVRGQSHTDTWRFKRRLECGSVTEDNEDAQTIFSEPWDSSRWENLLPSASEGTKDGPSESGTSAEFGFPSSQPFETSKNVDKTSTKKKIFPEGPDFPLSMPTVGLKSKELSATEASIRLYALHLASDKSTTFAQSIDNFIECTLESKETSPQVVMRNMRQFMSGMKNYLVKHGEREFEKQVEKERMKLKSTEFLNLDAILEGVMHKLVVRPLREHLYKLFVEEYIKTGAIQLLYENLNYARTKSLRDLGFKTKITPPSQEALEMVCHFISKLQEVDSPLEKLDQLLASVSTIIYSVKHSNQSKPGIVLGADDILPLFIWVLVQSGFIAAEIEAEYMWGLLHPSLLSGEGCYYLTTLSSAVHVLKNFKSCDLDQGKRLTSNEWQCEELKSVLKIIVPDELHGSILTKTLPVKPNMTTKDICKIIAHKIRITNPQDYGLFRLVDGEETLLNDTDCPQDIKSQFVEAGKHCTLAYKRIDAKIGWPRTT